MNSRAVALLGAAVAAVAVVPPLVPAGATSAAAPPVPTGQTTVVDSRTGFRTGLVGWQPLDATVQWAAGVGRHAHGALALRSSQSTSNTRAATSAAFAVTAGARYSAVAWSRSGRSSHRVIVGLKFFDADGSTIGGSTQLSQPVVNRASRWTKTYRTIGFAPANAASAAVFTMSLGSPTDVADYFDDITVWQTTGYATPVAGPLTTSGPAVLDAQGRRVTLHGIQLGGMRSMDWTPNTVTTAEIDAAHRWGANFARLPVAENPMLPDDCSYDPSYVDTVDRIVNDVTSRGMVILIDLHTNAVTDCGDWGQQQSLPDSKAITFWQTVANRYQANPLVAFDLYNEPHGVPDAVWRNGGTVTSGGATYDAVGMQALYDAVRSTGATNLVVASGRSWASVYPETAPLTGTTNLVWGVHAYTCPIATPENGGPCKPGPDGVLDPSRILDHFATVGTKQPVMITEFGWPDPKVGDYLTTVTSSATAHHWLGWTAFVFNASVGSQFDLAEDVGALWDPRPSGVAVITAMLAD